MNHRGIKEETSSRTEVAVATGDPGSMTFKDRFNFYRPRLGLRPSGVTLFFAGMTALLLSFSPLSAQESNDFQALKDFPSRVKKFTLKNGLRTVMVERPGIPTVSFAVYIRTGGLDDDPGKSGLAHMFEHMLFKGTKTIGTKNYAKEKPLLEKIDKAARALDRLRRQGEKASAESLKQAEEKLKALQSEHEKIIEEEEYWKIYEQAGAQGLNAGTGYDYTNYTVSLPVNHIKLWMEMESERIKNPVLREFYKERDVVLEERRLRIETRPSGKLWENFLATAYNVHPYGRPIVGWEDEISYVTVKDAEKFFARHYDISRLVIVMVGGFDPNEAEKMIRSYFGPIPSKGSHAEPDYFITPEPPQEGTRRVDVLFNAEPQILIGFHRPDMTHPDNPALEVLSDIFSAGRTSRFTKRIVEKNKTAVSAWAGSSTPGDRDPSLFVVGGTPRAPHTAADLEKDLLKEIEKIQKDPPSPEEVEKVKNFTLDYLIRQLSSNAGLARHLGFYEAVGGGWERLFQLLDEIQAVTPEDVQRVAQKYLTPDNMTVGVLVKKEK